MQHIQNRSLILLTGLWLALVIVGLVGTAYFTQAGTPNATNGSIAPTSGTAGSGMMGNGTWSSLGGVMPVATQTVTMTNQDAFAPQVIRIASGTTVTWTNTDLDAHTLTFMPGMTHNTVVTNGQHFQVTFTTPGTYDYLCLYHQGMVGQVIVTA